MTVNEAITKLRVMLSGSTDEVLPTPTQMEDEITEEVKEEVKMAEATLVDGTMVYTEGDLAPGAILYISTEEDEDPFLSEGMHETSEGLMITVGENGEIVSIEEAAAEAPTEEPVAEAMEEEVIEEEVKTEMTSEELLAAIADLINEHKEEVKEEMSALTERFNAIADEPATKPVRNNFTKEAVDAKTKADARLEQLIAIRKGRK